MKGNWLVPAKQPASQPASQRSKNIRFGPSALPRDKKYLTLDDSITVFIFFLCFFTDVLSNTFVFCQNEAFAKDIWNKIIKNIQKLWYRLQKWRISCLGEGRRARILYFWTAGWLAGWLAKNIRFWPLRECWVWISMVFVRCPYVFIFF